MSDTRTWRHLYGKARWKRLRQAQLSASPLCVYCLRRDIVEVATVVDHITPHKGDEALFFDSTNLQSLCKPCHDRDKAAEERGQQVTYYGVDGYPIE